MQRFPVKPTHRMLISSFRSWHVLLFILLVGGVCLWLCWPSHTDNRNDNSVSTVQVIWTFEPEERGAIVSSPLVAEKRIYVGVIHDVGFSAVGAVYCLERATGKVVWKFDDQGRMQHMFSSPCFSEGRIYIGEGMHQNFECKLYCLNAETGAKLWDFEVGNHIESSPCVADGRVFFGAGDDGLYCLDAKTGRTCWHFQEPLHVDSSPAVVGGHVYAGSGLSRKCETTEMFCLDARTGGVVWRRPTKLSVWGSPTVDRGKLFFGLGNGRMIEGPPPPEQPAGAVCCLQADSGRIRWQWQAPDAILVKPVVDSEHVYVGSRDGYCYCLDRGRGMECWRANTSSPVVARPALEGRHLYVVASQGQIYRLDATNGSIEWTFDVATYSQTKPRMYSSPTILADETTGAGHYWIFVAGELSGSVQSAAVLYALHD
jgi:outer membrane protein assembly factor BamB